MIKKVVIMLLGLATQGVSSGEEGIHTNEIRIGWAEVEITPQKLPVEIAGQLYARVSEGVKDPLMASVCVFDNEDEHVVFVSCDLVGISEPLYQAIRDQLTTVIPEMDPQKVIIHATHTHTGPDFRDRVPVLDSLSNTLHEVDLGNIASFEETLDGISSKVVEAISTAWSRRAAGGVAFGQDYAVLGRNRRWTSEDGTSTMYGLSSPAAKERFRHIDGYEDHSLNLLATYDQHNQLTGILINLPCPSQEEGGDFQLSADFWYETRIELRKRFGKDLFILPQVSAAGELTSRLIYENEAHQRMLQLRNSSARQEIAERITHSVGRILPIIRDTAVSNPVLMHETTVLELPLNPLKESDLEYARQEVDRLQLVYQQELEKLEQNPELKKDPRWYVKATRAFRTMRWNAGVIQRYEQQKTQPTRPAEVHIIRLGEIAFATNPFEYYVDFGIQIKVRSPAIQTFLVQLAGAGSYIPSPRSVLGGGYGSTPASNPVGPDGGQILADYTVEALRKLFE